MSIRCTGLGRNPGNGAQVHHKAAQALLKMSDGSSGIQSRDRSCGDQGGSSSWNSRSGRRRNRSNILRDLVRDSGSALSIDPREAGHAVALPNPKRCGRNRTPSPGPDEIAQERILWSGGVAHGRMPSGCADGISALTQTPAGAPPPPSATVLDVRYPPGSRVVRPVPPFRTDTVRELSRGLVAAGDPCVSWDGRWIYFVGKGSRRPTGRSTGPMRAAAGPSA